MVNIWENIFICMSFWLRRIEISDVFIIIIFIMYATLKIKANKQ